MSQAPHATLTNVYQPDRRIAATLHTLTVADLMNNWSGEDFVRCLPLIEDLIMRGYADEDLGDGTLSPWTCDDPVLAQGDLREWVVGVDLSDLAAPDHARLQALADPAQTTPASQYGIIPFAGMS